MRERRREKDKVLKSMLLLGVFLLIFGISYSLFQVALNGTKKNKITTGILSLQLLDEHDVDITTQEASGYSIDLQNALPTSDGAGIAQEGFTFKLVNNGTIPAKYKIYLDDVELEQGESRLADTYVKYSLIKNDSIDYPEPLSYIGTNPNRILDMGLIKPSETNIYTLKLWVDENADAGAMDKVFNSVLRVDGVQYNENNPFDSGTAAYTLFQTRGADLPRTLGNGFDPNSEVEGLRKYKDINNDVSYVFRGINVNNYVTYAGMTWRILRIKDDGSLKLVSEDPLNYEPTDPTRLYFGENADAKYHLWSNTIDGITYVEVPYNYTEDDIDDVKYKDSLLERYLDSWYIDVMKNYGNRIAVSEYCSDRSEDTNSIVYFLYITQMHMYSNVYGAYNNILIESWDHESMLTDEQMAEMKWQPKLSCTLDKISKKVATIDAVEYILAGGSTYGNANYLDEEIDWWTMSPFGLDLTSNKAYVANIYDNSLIMYASVADDLAVKPVITLKPDSVIASGNGSSDSPYVIG